mmetsp:Transcript_7703/g.23842  ORF Transcript_7703/g.23842 Transcript_7703/m.23842 type:complete len:245 (-) Transcript_7703:6-740(-)
MISLACLSTTSLALAAAASMSWSFNWHSRSCPSRACCWRADSWSSALVAADSVCSSWRPSGVWALDSSPSSTSRVLRTKTSGSDWNWSRRSGLEAASWSFNCCHAVGASPGEVRVRAGLVACLARRSRQLQHSAAPCLRLKGSESKASIQTQNAHCSSWAHFSGVVLANSRTTWTSLAFAAHLHSPAVQVQILLRKPNAVMKTMSCHLLESLLPTLEIQASSFNCACPTSGFSSLRVTPLQPSR